MNTLLMIVHTVHSRIKQHNILLGAFRISLWIVFGSVVSVWLRTGEWLLSRLRIEMYSIFGEMGKSLLMRRWRVEWSAVAVRMGRKVS